MSLPRMARHMAGDLEMCAAAFFRTVGKDVATPDEFVMGVSLGQKWMTPSDAKTVLNTMTASGVLVSSGGYIRPGKSIDGLDVPLAYHPPKDLAASCAKNAAPAPARKDAAKQPKDMFHLLMDAAVDAGIQRREFIQECNRIQKTLDIDIAVAALIVLRDKGVPIGRYADKAYGLASITPS